MTFAGLARSLAGRIGRQPVSVSVLDMATRPTAQAFLTALPMLFAVASFSPPAVREELRRTLRMLLGTAGPVFSQVEGVDAGGDAEASHTWGAVGLLLALVSATAFSRALQRLCERAAAMIVLGVIGLGGLGTAALLPRRAASAARTEH